MKIARIGAILFLGILLVSGFACGPGPEGPPTPTPTPVPTSTPQPTTCEADRDAVQAAIDDYYAEHGEWPTSDGAPGDIEWDKLVPDFLATVPTTDGSCDWSVNSDPVGTVCVGESIGCVPCSCRCSTRCSE